MATCPYCGQATELRLATPPHEPSVPRRVLVFTAVAVLILVFVLVACFVALKWAESRRNRPAEAAPASLQK